MIVINGGEVQVEVTWIEDDGKKTRMLSPGETWIIEPGSEDQLEIKSLR